MKEHDKPSSLKDYQLALFSRAVFDIPPRTRRLLVIAGVGGIVILTMECLVGRQDHTVPLDKIIHFSGYCVLSLTFVLALRPILFVPGLVGLVLMGIAIEFLQRHTGRSFDWYDAYANTLGVATGAGLGLAARGVYAYVQKEFAAKRVQRQLISFAADQVILHEGDPVEQLFLIKSGKVKATRQRNGVPIQLAQGGPGGVIGLLSIAEDEPQFTTVTALEPTTVYRMSLEELMDSAGGRELPISQVLLQCIQKLREVGVKLTEEGIEL